MHDLTDSPPIRVFVYGTLRRGESNSGYLNNATYLGRAVTPPRYHLFDTGPFPAAAARGRHALVGEVYAVDRAILRTLDRLEDVPRSYNRWRIDTRYGDAWLYLWVAAIDPRWPRLAGDWCQRRRVPGRGSARRR
ncbi:MAG: gamma-glutamylcyclotransferase family protein [Salinisphaeraceae bacterium]